MEDIEAQVQEKSIERIKTEIKEIEVKKPKKERTQAQKDAFEKARKKRQANLEKKKIEAQGLSEAQDEVMDDYYGEPDNEVQEIVKEEPKPEKVIQAPKKRGRPRKKKEEPPAPHFIPPTNSMPSMYPVQGQFNPYAFYGGMMPPQQQPQPVVHNYYYGANPKETERETIREVKPQEQEPEVQFEPEVYQEVEEEYEDEYELPSDPRLKYRFA